MRWFGRSVVNMFCIQRLPAIRPFRPSVRPVVPTYAYVRAVEPAAVMQSHAANVVDETSYLSYHRELPCETYRSIGTHNITMCRTLLGPFSILITTSD